MPDPLLPRSFTFKQICFGRDNSLLCHFLLVSSKKISEHPSNKVHLQDLITENVFIIILTYSILQIFFYSVNSFEEIF